MALYVHAPVQDAHNINAVRQRKIENQVIPHGQTPQPGLKIGAAEDAIVSARPLAAVALVGWVGAVAWLLSR